MKKEISQISKQLSIMEHNLKNWNLRDIDKKIDNTTSLIQDLWSNSENFIKTLKNSIAEINLSINSDDYIKMIETEFNDNNLIVSGEFPKYQLGPFRINFNIKENLIEMIYAKKKKRFFTLDPKTAVSEIHKEYKKLMDKPFNKNEFCRELLNSYEILNINQYKNPDIKWGSPVSLLKIYDMLTLKLSVKKEYSINNFSFDISKLKETDMIFDDKIFELTQGTPKNALVIANEKGESFYFTSLTIHQK
jgi:hypothetical protein